MRAPGRRSPHPLRGPAARVSRRAGPGFAGQHRGRPRGRPASELRGGDDGGGVGDARRTHRARRRDVPDDAGTPQQPCPGHRRPGHPARRCATGTCPRPGRRGRTRAGRRTAVERELVLGLRRSGAGDRRLDPARSGAQPERRMDQRAGVRARHAHHRAARLRGTPARGSGRGDGRRCAIAARRNDSAAVLSRRRRRRRAGIRRPVGAPE